MEIENNGTAVDDLILRLNADPDATRAYGYVDTGFVGTDAIAVAFIYDTDTVTPVGDFALLDSSVSPAFLDSKNRPAIAQTFEDVASGEMVTLAVNHLKSKGSPCDITSNPGDPAYGVESYDADPELEDYAGNCNLTRTAPAQVLGQWLDSDPSATGAEYAMVLGDLNAYANEDPIVALEALGYTDLNEEYSEGNAWAAGGHTYVYDGELGSLDYALANSAILERVTGAAAWHLNADEPSALDYNDYNPVSNYEPDEWRSSDHDAVIVGLALGSVAPELTVVVSPDMLWPSNHKYRTVVADVTATDNSGAVTVELVSVTSSEPDCCIKRGDRPNDIRVIDDTTFELGAERYSRDGRTYTVSTTAARVLGVTPSRIYQIQDALERHRIRARPAAGVWMPQTSAARRFGWPHHYTEAGIGSIRAFFEV